nr:hypothetical protein [Tanacetum cinerariifolium]
MLVAGSCHTNAEKQKLQTANANDPFRSYSFISSSNKYTDLYATGVARNVQNMANNARASDDIGSSNRQNRTVGNSQIMLTPVEATTSKITIRFPMINSNISAGHSGKSQRVSRRVNAEGCSSAAAVALSLLWRLFYKFSSTVSMYASYQERNSSLSFTAPVSHNNDTRNKNANS